MAAELIAEVETLGTPAASQAAPVVTASRVGRYVNISRPIAGGGLALALLLGSGCSDGTEPAAADWIAAVGVDLQKRTTRFAAWARVPRGGSGQ